MDNRTKVELAVDGAILALLLLYVLSLNPTTYVYLRNYIRWLRWWLWSVSNPEWLKEALQVRGYTP